MIQFESSAPRNGSETGGILDGEIEHILHFFLVNRGMLITPFHNMMLVCPHTTSAEVARLVSLLDDCLAQIVQTVVVHPFSTHGDIRDVRSSRRCSNRS